jgi:predicted nucleic acid-binding protein
VPDALLDTGILIRHLRRRPGYAEMLARLADDGELYISVFTRVEVIRGMRDHEREITLALLNSVLTISLDVVTADLAGELVRHWAGQGIILGDADAVIAASALQKRLVLVTTNARHFPMPELVVLQADEQGHLSSRAA